MSSWLCVSGRWSEMKSSFPLQAWALVQAAAASNSVFLGNPILSAFGLFVSLASLEWWSSYRRQCLSGQNRLHILQHPESFKNVSPIFKKVRGKLSPSSGEAVSAVWMFWLATDKLPNVWVRSLVKDDLYKLTAALAQVHGAQVQIYRVQLSSTGLQGAGSSPDPRQQRAAERQKHTRTLDPHPWPKAQPCSWPSVSYHHNFVNYRGEVHDVSFSNCEVFCHVDYRFLFCFQNFPETDSVFSTLPGRDRGESWQ